MLLGQKGGHDLVFGIASGQGGVEASTGPLVEAFVAGEQQLADVIERVALAAPMAGQALLGASADLVDSPVAQAHHVKRVRHDHRVDRDGLSPAR